MKIWLKKELTLKKIAQLTLKKITQNKYLTFFFINPPPTAISHSKQIPYISNNFLNYIKIFISTFKENVKTFIFPIINEKDFRKMLPEEMRKEEIVSELSLF